MFSHFFLKELPKLNFQNNMITDLLPQVLLILFYWGSLMRIHLFIYLLFVSFQELWSMLQFMMPDLFETGDVDLKKLFGVEDQDLITQIKSILGPFILRRLKSDVMRQLVPKIQRVQNVFGFML